LPEARSKLGRAIRVELFDGYLAVQVLIASQKDDGNTTPTEWLD
jgi:hypothetical protein